jgi:hypothetical protein
MVPVLRRMPGEFVAVLLALGVDGDFFYAHAVLLLVLRRDRGRVRR